MPESYLTFCSRGPVRIRSGQCSIHSSKLRAGFLLGKTLSAFTNLLKHPFQLLQFFWRDVMETRPRLTGQVVYPRPLQDPLPIWAGVGGTAASFVRACTLGLPSMVAIIGGEPKRFRPLIDLYREAGQWAGHPEEKLLVGLHAIGFLGNTNERSCGRFLSGVRPHLHRDWQGTRLVRGLNSMPCADQRAPCRSGTQKLLHGKCSTLIRFLVGFLASQSRWASRLCLMTRC